MNVVKRYYTFYFVLFFAWSALYTLIAIYLNESAGFKLSEIGSLMSALPIITLIFQPIWGAVSDGTNHKKRLLMLIMGANVFIALMLTVVSVKWMIVALYCLYTVFLCAQSPLTDAMAIAQVNHSRKGSYGAIRSWGSMGYAIGALAVAQIVYHIGLKAIFYIAALGIGISIFLLSKIPENQVEVSRTNYLKDLKSLVQNKKYVFVLIYGFFIVGTFSGGDQYLGLYFRTHGIAVSEIGILNFIAVFIEALFIFYSKRLIQLFGVEKMMIIMNLTGMTRLLILSFGSSWGMFVISSVLRGGFVGIFVPLFIELISEIAPKSLTTSGISIYSAASSGIAAFLFTLLGGLIADKWGYASLYGVYSVVMIMPMLLFFGLKKTNK